MIATDCDWLARLAAQQATQPFESTALLPCASQCMLDFLVEARERMQAQGLQPWVSSLPCLSDVAELSALTKWLLEPASHACPRVSMRLAYRAGQLTSVTSTIYAERGWTCPDMDAQLVGVLEKVTHGAALNVRPAQLQTVGEQAKELSAALGKYSAIELTFRVALLHRFNQVRAPPASPPPPRTSPSSPPSTSRPPTSSPDFPRPPPRHPRRPTSSSDFPLPDLPPPPPPIRQLLARHLPLVHTGLPRKGDSTLGGRICALRGVVLMEIKLSALEQSIASTTSDTDATIVMLNRFKATKLRARAEAERSGAGTLFSQLHTQVARVKPRALCRPDKAFRVNLVGEAADDHGGPYREALAEISREVQSSALPLFIQVTTS